MNVFCSKTVIKNLGSAVGGRYLFSSSFEYADFVEKSCVGVGAPGVSLLAGAAVLRRDDFQVFGMAFMRPQYIVNGHCTLNFLLNSVRDKKLKSALSRSWM